LERSGFLTLANIAFTDSSRHATKLNALVVLLFIGVVAVACQFNPNSHPSEDMNPGQAG